MKQYTSLITWGKRNITRTATDKRKQTTKKQKLLQKNDILVWRSWNVLFAWRSLGFAIEPFHDR